MNRCPLSPREIRPVFIGEKAPLEALVVEDGEQVTLEKVLGGKHNIVAFYRGGW